MPVWLQVVLTFALGIVAAWIRVLFTRRTAEGRAVGAANYHTIISASAAWGAILYVGNNRLVIPLLIGCWIGTYAAVVHDHRHSPTP